jgi:hypothetical protein
MVNYYNPLIAPSRSPMMEISLIIDQVAIKGENSPAE